MTQVVSGSAMDRKLEKKSTSKPYLISGAIGALLLVIYLGISQSGAGRNSLSLDKNQLKIASVTLDTFEDFIPIRGQVAPLKTVYLDAIEGGRVEKILVEDGTMLKAGQPIVQLSNTSLQLSVTRNEALVTEQLNNMRTIELQLEQNRLAHKRNLIEINYQIKRLNRLVKRHRKLFAQNRLSASELEATEDELEYQIQRRDVTLESQKTDARLQESQLKSLQTASKQLQRNLSFSRQNLDNLHVKAPIDGKLSGLDIEIGQSIKKGGRLGQVSDPSALKIRAFIDEFYLSRVFKGQQAELVQQGKTFTLSIGKIYPKVNNGQFETDLLFEHNAPPPLRLGQSQQLKLKLGDNTQARLIPNGSFLQDSGGNWVYVLLEGGHSAEKRLIKTGRRNSQYVEVLSGLQTNEQLITSGYSNFSDYDYLELRD